MNLVEINEATIAEWEREASIIEQQQQRLINYSSALRGLCISAKTYLKAKMELEQGDISNLKPFQEPFQSSPSAPNGSTPSPLPQPSFQVTSEEVEIPLDTFKQLGQAQAIFKYFSLSPRQTSAITIYDSLRRGGFQSKTLDFWQSLNSMLRYYERKKILERDGADLWRVMPPYTGEDILNLLKSSNGHNSHGKSIAEYCVEVLEKSGKKSLHVDDFVRILNEEYRLNKTKDVVATALRKNSNNKRFFKFYGKNCFGLLKEETKTTGGLRLIPQVQH